MTTVKNIIIGAGPAGLQLGYYFEKAGLDYLILERSGGVASFFGTYPLSGKLISINKPNTGSADPDFRLRHDWNSLLSDDPSLVFPRNYSNDYYPDHTDLVRYMTDFATKNALKIQFNTEVNKILPGYTLECVIGGVVTTYTCEKLIMATGLSKPIMPPILGKTATPPKHYSEFPKDHFKKAETLETYRDKSLLLIGNGNGAFELGNLLNPYCSSVTIYGRTVKAWSASTHYTGDLRSVYLPFLDTFLLKSQNAINVDPFKIVIDQEEGGKYTLTYICSPQCSVKHPYLTESIEGFDHIIYCTGWTFDYSIFHFPLALTGNRKYPHITPTYESSNNKNLFFIGSLMHSLDYKKSSGGFIHGFRYLIKYFMNLNFGGMFDVVRLSKEALTQHVLKRINTSSALYQMQGEMCDFFYRGEDGAFVYYHDVTSPFHESPEFKPTDNYFAMLRLEYGSKIIKEVDNFGKRVSAVGKECESPLIHPVLRVFKDKQLVDEVHFDEDLYTNFTSKYRYEDKFRRTLLMFYPENRDAFTPI